MRSTDCQTVYVQINGTEIAVEVDYCWTPGSPEEGPSYASGGQPAEGPEIEICGMTVGGEEVPKWFFDAALADGSIEDHIREHHED